MFYEHTFVIRYFKTLVYKITYIQLSQFIWEPYTDDVLALLPDVCRSDPHIWRTRSPMICFDIVEWHYPQRVLRQFGHVQGIPGGSSYDAALHKLDRRGRHSEDWAIRHQPMIELWNIRHQNIMDGTHTSNIPHRREDYMAWYRSRTRLIISPPKKQPLGAYQSTAPDLHMMVSS